MEVRYVTLIFRRDPELADVLFLNYSPKEFNLDAETQLEVIDRGGNSPVVRDSDGAKCLIKRASLYKKPNDPSKYAIGPELKDDPHTNSCLLHLQIMASSGRLSDRRSEAVIADSLSDKVDIIAEHGGANQLAMLLRLPPAAELFATLNGNLGESEVYRIYWDEGELQVVKIRHTSAQDEWQLA